MNDVLNDNKYDTNTDGYATISYIIRTWKPKIRQPTT